MVLYASTGHCVVRLSGHRRLSPAREEDVQVVCSGPWYHTPRQYRQQTDQQHTSASQLTYASVSTEDPSSTRERHIQH
eukprot:1950367-Rhodomonas_salina.2